MITKDRVEELVSRIRLEVLGTEFDILVEQDKKPFSGNTRVYIQLQFAAYDRSQNAQVVMRGRKWYLSSHMTDDEVVKTVYLAFRTAVEHEVLEGFMVDGVRVFNPHTPFTELLRTGKVEETRASDPMRSANAGAHPITEAILKELEDDQS